MSTVQDFTNGWRWMNEHGRIWGDLHWTRYYAMQKYVYWFMNNDAAKLEEVDKLASPNAISVNVVRLLWRRHRRIGKISLVKSTEVHYDDWLDLEKDL